ncbi:MAG: response regulator transcription factor [Bacteroidetes bacterium]|nr:MAG: response regulator transcription factor [Bacteroidota bacterium]
MKVVIVEDEPHARTALRHTLERHADVTVSALCRDGVSALREVTALRPDVLFLDIRIPDPDGFALLRALPPEAMPLVVFVTAYHDHAVRAFDVNAVDYIVKPFEEDRVDRSLERVRKVLASGNIAEELSKVQAVLKETAAAVPPMLTVRNRGTQSLIPLHEIESVEAEGDYVRITAKRVHLVHMTLTQAVAQLPATFVRIHRSAAVNTAMVKEIRTRLRGDYLVVLRSGRTLLMSRTYRDALARILRPRAHHL